MGAQQIRAGTAVEEPWLVRRSGQLMLRGDDTGALPLFVHRGAEALTLSHDPAALLDDLHQRGLSATLCPTGISHFLHHGLVPLPGTIFRDLYFLGIGDRAEVGVADGEIALDFSQDYPYLLERSSGRSQPDPARLLQLTAQAASRQLGSSSPAFLMLSSGKDSSALALGLAEAGFADLPCVTFRAADADPEPPIAADLCRRLGLRHEIVELGLGDRGVEELLRSFFTESPLPCGDFVQIPYVLCVSRMGASASAVLDGSGNDAYMGYVPSLRDRAKRRLALRHGALSRSLARCLGPESGWNYFLRGPAAATLPGRMLRPIDTRRFHADGEDTYAWWQRLSDEWAHLDDIAFRNSPMEHHVDQAQIALKVRLAAGFQGQRALLPFCDADLIDYCFHLPERARFDRRSHVNKVLLREMLLRFADYDADKIGKGFFEFDGARFLLDHRDFALEEITGCGLWEPEIRRRTEAWFRRLERRPLLYHALLPLLMLSGWYNHSRFRGRLSP